ncbi:hypothetical protein QE152_g7839 [Popillia japonica]|uniref:Uncharacterized protein n=1 Tax=Popillia japonica TaxID=7064 RepID=A0AAW1MEC8_POPJA
MKHRHPLYTGWGDKDVAKGLVFSISEHHAHVDPPGMASPLGNFQGSTPRLSATILSISEHHAHVDPPGMASPLGNFQGSTPRLSATIL